MNEPAVNAQSFLPTGRCRRHYRRRHGAQHRAYARDLRHLVRDLSLLESEQRDEALRDRREALADAADNLRRLARTSWRRPLASFGLGLAGSAVAIAAGNLRGGGIAAGSALLGFRRQADPGNAYTYVFQAQDHLSDRRR